jgi:hypothetical protein
MCEITCPFHEIANLELKRKFLKFKNQIRIRVFPLPAHLRHLTTREREGQDTWVDEHKLHKAIDPEAHIRV